MFLTAELISGQIEKIKKIAITDRAKIQPVASELPCFLVQTLSQLILRSFLKIHLSYRLDFTSSFRTTMFISTK